MIINKAWLFDKLLTYWSAGYWVHLFNWILEVFQIVSLRSNNSCFLVLFLPESGDKIRASDWLSHSTHISILSSDWSMPSTAEAYYYNSQADVSFTFLNSVRSRELSFLLCTYLYWENTINRQWQSVIFLWHLMNAKLWKLGLETGWIFLRLTYVYSYFSDVCYYDKQQLWMIG